VNISGELSKSGVLPQELPALLAVIETCDNLCLRGLMAIPEKNASQASFIEMQNLFLALKKQYPTMDTLSMGMSADLQLAINAGSTLVRIGSAIFGARS
jgi:pyridoxal phosphate enzyme (YggS family)